MPNKNHIETLSDNSVQQDVINKLFGSTDPDYPLDLQDGEDIYDFANYICALRKAADWLEEHKLKPLIESFPEHFPETVDFYLSDAMNDWPIDQAKEDKRKNIRAQGLTWQQILDNITYLAKDNPHLLNQPAIFVNTIGSGPVLIKTVDIAPNERENDIEEAINTPTTIFMCSEKI